jgi:hypothetical protein
MVPYPAGWALPRVKKQKPRVAAAPFAVNAGMLARCRGAGQFFAALSAAQKRTDPAGHLGVSLFKWPHGKGPSVQGGQLAS